MGFQFQIPLIVSYYTKETPYKKEIEHRINSWRVYVFWYVSALWSIDQLDFKGIVIEHNQASRRFGDKENKGKWYELKKNES